MTFPVFGQNDKPVKLEISIGGGLSFPVGSYSQNNPSESVILDNEVSFNRIVGFAKNKNGFAKTGYNYNLQIKYKLSPSFHLIFLTSRFTNPVETNTITDYLIEVHQRDEKFEESDYKILSITPGVGYEFSFKKIEVNTNLFLGYANAQYPYYKIVLLYTATDPPLILAHDGATKNLSAFTCGASVSAEYSISDKFKIGLDAIYQNSNFAYQMSNRLIPGGSQVFEISDILKVKVINMGIRLAYRF